jgi:hypothetical protein
MNVFGRLFHKMDLAVFALLVKVQENENYKKLVQRCQQLDDQQRRWVAPLSLGAIFVVPALLLLIFFFSNHRINRDISIMKQAVVEIENFRYGQAQLASLEASFVSPRPVNNFGELDQYLRSVFGPLGLNMVSLKLEEFQIDQISDRISQVSADLTFSQISNADLAILLRGILGPGRMQLGDFSLERDGATQTLKGRLALRYLQKSLALD